MSSEVIEKNFFFLDSNSLSAVETNLYGYCVANETGGAELSFADEEFSKAYSNGVYVLVQSLDDKIIVSQDYNGACGIYVYRQGDYFALSNSFLTLVEKLDAKFPMSFNYDYANAYMAAILNSISYSETLVNEIELLPRNAQVIIDKAEKKLEVVDIDYQEHSVEIASPEGLRLLDTWFDKWTGMIRELKAETGNISCDLSGGFDSRLVFGLFAHAGINLNEIQILSVHDKLHVHEEDYRIATQIAEHYDVSLNRKNTSEELGNFSLEECINISFHTKLGVHKQMAWKTKYYKEPFFRFAGGGGECLRAAWYQKPSYRIKKECMQGKRYRHVEVSEAVSRILNNAYEKTSVKFPSIGNDDPELTHLLYRETRGRHHFGKAQTEDYCANAVTVAPLTDSCLGKLYSSNSSDADLLIAVIFTRYYPELLKFPIQGGRKIKEETIARAEKINELLPFNESGRTAGSEKKMIYWRENKLGAGSEREISISDADKYVYDIFRSDKAHKLIAACFHEDIWRYAESYAKKHDFFPLSEVYSATGAYIVLDILMNRKGKEGASVAEQLRDSAKYAFVNPTLHKKKKREILYYLYFWLKSKKLAQFLIRQLRAVKHKVSR